MTIEYRKFINGRVTAKYQTSAEKAEVIDKMLAEASHFSTAHGNCRPVTACSNQEEL